MTAIPPLSAVSGSPHITVITSPPEGGEEEQNTGRDNHNHSHPHQPLNFGFQSYDADRAGFYRRQAQSQIESEIIKMVRQVEKGEKPYLIQTRIMSVDKGMFQQSGAQNNTREGFLSNWINEAASSTSTRPSTSSSEGAATTSGGGRRRSLSESEIHVKEEPQEEVEFIEEIMRKAKRMSRKRRASNSEDAPRVESPNQSFPKLPADKMYVKFGTKLSKRKYALLLQLMAKIYENLVTSQNCTVRDMFYENVASYGTQVRLEKGLYDLCHILKVPRDALRVDGSSKGMIAGNLSYTLGDNRINVGQFKSGMLIPSMSSLDDIRDILSDAKQIIVVEKDAVFQRLIGEHLLDELDSTILITGKGYPDLATLKMIRKLRDALKVKVFALVDCDPYGAEIAAVIRWGSNKQASIAKCANDWMISDQLTVPDLVWIGLLPSELAELALPTKSSSAMTERDYHKLASVKQRVMGKGDDIWMKEINRMGMTGIKAELEALFIHTRFANFYLKQKLKAFNIMQGQQRRESQDSQSPSQNSQR